GKGRLKEQLLELLAADLEVAERAQRETQAAATHEEARPENDKDTRALEQSYVARGQAMRVLELRTEIAQTRALSFEPSRGPPRVVLGSLVTVEEDEGSFTLLIAPARGGTRLDGDVQVITPASPLGRALVGRGAGDECEVRVAGRVRALSVLR